MRMGVAQRTPGFAFFGARAVVMSLTIGDPLLKFAGSFGFPRPTPERFPHSWLDDGEGGGVVPWRS